MKNCSDQENQRDDLERETNLLNVIIGDGSDEYFILANWNDLPVEAEQINGCVVSVKSFADKFEWQTILSFDTWLFMIKRIACNSFVMSTVDGDLIYITDGQAETIKTDLGCSICDIWVINDRNFWLACDDGLAHWNGQRIFEKIFSATIYAIHALSAYFAVAVGAEGIVLTFDGKTWREIDSSPTNKNLVGVFCVTQDQIFICGWRGALYKWDGKNNWEKIKFVSKFNSSEIYAGSPVEYLGDVYVCGDGCGLFKIHGNKAVQVETFYASRAIVINEKLVVTGGNLLHEFDGKKWFQVKIVLPE